MNANAELTTHELAEQLDRFTDRFGTLRNEIGKAVVGYEQLVTDTLVAIFCQGTARSIKYVR